jgi:peptidyl-tRNA hydrolase
MNSILNKSDSNNESKISESVLETPEEELTMYILINKDLGMTKGKIASQVGHGVHHVIHDIFIDASTSTSDETKESFKTYNMWTQRAKKITLNVPFVDLQQYIDNSKYKCSVIIDAGRTQVAPNSLTVVCFHPSNTLKNEMKKYKLL